MSAADQDTTVHPRDAELIGWLSGALEPGEERRLASELASSPALRRRLDVLRARIAEPQDEAPVFRIPPPWARQPGAALQGRAELQGARWAGQVEGATGFAGGDEDLLVTLRVLPPDEEDRLVVVLVHEGERWRVLLPSSPDMALRLRELDREGAEHILEVRPRVRGRLRYVVALPRVGEADPVWDGPEDLRWEALRHALAQSRIPTLSIELEAP